MRILGATLDNSMALSNSANEFLIKCNGLISLLPDLGIFSDPTYPSYNIISIDSNSYILEFMVPNFAVGELTVEVKEKELHVSGNKEFNRNRDEYIWHGYSTKGFIKVFSIAEYVEVNLSTYENGVLRVYLRYTPPQEKASRKIKIEG